MRLSQLWASPSLWFGLMWAVVAFADAGRSGGSAAHASAPAPSGSIGAGVAASAIPSTPRPQSSAHEPSRRRGTTVSLGGYGSLGVAYGYPDNATKVGDDRYYASTGTALGGSGSLAVGYALTEVVTVSLVGFGSYLEAKRFRSSSFGGGFRLNFFPWGAGAGPLRDLGISTDFGVGHARLDPKVDGVERTSVTQSHLGLGVMHEIRIASPWGGAIVLAPELRYDYVFARPLDRHSLSLGGRFVFYAGP